MKKRYACVQVDQIFCMCLHVCVDIITYIYVCVYVIYVCMFVRIIIQYILLLRQS